VSIAGSDRVSFAAAGIQVAAIAAKSDQDALPVERETRGAPPSVEHAIREPTPKLLIAIGRFVSAARDDVTKERPALRALWWSWWQRWWQQQAQEREAPTVDRQADGSGALT
jgi:hypothetical protein